MSEGLWPKKTEEPALQRLLTGIRVDEDTGCWLWEQGQTDSGYGKMRRGASTVRVHRLVWELLVGPIPEGLELDHLCSVRLCVNPAHLEPVTHQENQRRVSPRNKPTSKVNTTVFGSGKYLAAYEHLYESEEE